AHVHLGRARLGLEQCPAGTLEDAACISVTTDRTLARFLTLEGFPVYVGESEIVRVPLINILDVLAMDHVCSTVVARIVTISDRLTRVRGSRVRQVDLTPIVLGVGRD